MSDRAVKIVKLITGEDLLTQVDEWEGDKVKLTKPMMLVMQQGPQGGLQMVPWLMLAKEESVVVDSSSVLLSYEPKEELVSAYQQQTGSIVTAPANALDSKGKIVT